VQSACALEQKTYFCFETKCSDCSWEAFLVVQDYKGTNNYIIFIKIPITINATYIRLTITIISIARTLLRWRKHATDRLLLRWKHVKLAICLRWRPPWSWCFIFKKHRLQVQPRYAGTVASQPAPSKHVIFEILRFLEGSHCSQSTSPDKAVGTRKCCSFRFSFVTKLGSLWCHTIPGLVKGRWAILFFHKCGCSFSFFCRNEVPIHLGFRKIYTILFKLLYE